MESGLLLRLCAALSMKCICVLPANLWLGLSCLCDIAVHNICVIHTVPTYCCAGPYHTLGRPCVLSLLSMLVK
jgi:hypothetical protein